MKNNKKKNKQEAIDISWKVSSKVTMIAATALFMSGCASTDSVKERELSDQLLQKIDERDQKIAERDREIDDLQNRMAQLESRNIAYSRSSAANMPVKTQAAEKITVAVPVPPTQVAASTVP
ncbi:MAG: hypothetical protein K9L22_13190, partial [Methylococcaceae bacterium]|nr:hypothetical protein [Methylococcaceae bacterium]